MADDGSDRTEEPTAKRLREARRDGNVPRSNDLTSAIGLVAGILLLRVFGMGILEGLLNIMREVGREPILFIGDLTPLIKRVSWQMVSMLLPFLVLLMLITVLGTVVQFGFLFTAKQLKPDLNNLSPMKGLKKMFSKQAVARLAMGLVKMGIVGAVAWFTLAGKIGMILAAGTLHAWGALNLAIELLYTLALRLALALLALGIIDYLWQRYQRHEKLKMTKTEVKDEMKQTIGDPEVKKRQRRQQMEMAMQRLGTEVPKADVVVTNPTEFSVALAYDEDKMAAPKVVAKGADFVALRIRQLAQQHGIPIVQRPPLARALYAQVEVGREVPPAFYRAVAELLAYVYQISGRAAKAG